MAQKGTAAMAKVTKVCECGQSFTTYPSVNKRHCSRSCSLRYLPRKPRTGTVVACEQCGAEFYRDPTEAKKGTGRFCSVACHNAAQTKPAVIKACARCGAELRLKPSQAHVQYCSKACQAQARTKRPLDRLHNGRPARMDKQGYVMVYEPSHPNKSFKGWQYEHRLIAEVIVGRHLVSDEHVHHINGIKDDNRPENLAVMDGDAHAALSAADYRDQLQRDRAELAEYRRRFGRLE